MPNVKKVLTAMSVMLMLAVSAPNMALANDRGTESGDDVSIILDLAVLRPVGLVATVAGLAIFIGSLPISLPTLSVGKAFNALVLSPAKYTFVRELGDER